MKCFSVCVLIIAVTGCTTLRPIDGTPKELQQFINSGELLQPGDRVRIVSADDGRLVALPPDTDDRNGRNGK
jgi:hypothetical protein